MWEDTARYAPHLLPMETKLGHAKAVETLLKDPRADLFQASAPTSIAAFSGQAESLALLLADERAVVGEWELLLAMDPHWRKSLEQMEAVLDLLLSDPRIL